MKTMTLSQLMPGKRGTVLENRCPPELLTRLEDLGMTEGMEITCLHRSPAGSPAAYDIRGAAVALRKSDADLIWVEAEL